MFQSVVQKVRRTGNMHFFKIYVILNVLQRSVRI